MKFSASALVLLSVSVPAVSSGSVDANHALRRGQQAKTPLRIQRCGTKDPSLEESRAVEALLQSRALRTQDNRRAAMLTCDQLCDQCINVKTVFHLTAFTDQATGTYYPHPTSAVEIFNSNGVVPLGGFSSESKIKNMVDEQLQYLNNAYKGTPFRFVDGEAITTVVEKSWGSFALDHIRNITHLAPHSGEGKDLNVYLVYGAGSEDDDGNSVTAGFADFPHNQNGRDGDAIFMRYDTLPNGGLTNTDVGETLVHEVGHWMGLQHVFSLSHGDYFHSKDPENPCDQGHAGDFVDDTAQMAYSTDQYLNENGISCTDILEGNAAAPDTCPDSQGVDPVFNYMNYLDKDECFEKAGSFSCNQKERMYRHWVLFRDHVNGCDSDEMEIEMAVEFDPEDGAEFDNGIVVGENHFWLQETGGKVIFNSTEDSCNDFVFNDVLLVDVCVPKDKTYSFVLYDKFNDGLGGGYFEVLVDGKLVQRVEGSFQSPLVIPISASSGGSETSSAATLPSFVWTAMLLGLASLAAM